MGGNESIALSIEHVAVAELVPDPANLRLHGPRNVDAIKASLVRFGQQKPLVVDAQGVVRAGNGTFQAAKELGWPYVAVVRTPLEGAEATAYAIADNRTADLAEWDIPALALQLTAFEEELLGATGYKPEELEDLTRLAEAFQTGTTDRESEWEGMPEYQSGEKKAAFTTTIHFPTEEDAEEFFARIERKRTRYLWWPESDGYVGSSLTGPSWKEADAPGIHPVEGTSDDGADAEGA